MKNYEISNANYALSQLLDEPLKGKAEQEEILQEEQEVNIDKFTEEELEQIDLSMRQIAMLKPIIQFEEGEN